MKVTMNDVLKLIETVSASNLTKFEYEDDDFSIAMASKKKHNNRGHLANGISDEQDSEEVQRDDVAYKDIEDENQAGNANSSDAENNNTNLKNEAQQTKSEEGKEGQLVCSPLVGTFYAAKEEGAEPFVKVGDAVKKGQVIGIVEAMKLMNEVESEYDGVVAEILVENEQMVEYSQPLVRIV